jgi:hypothetical protein
MDLQRAAYKAVNDTLVSFDQIFSKRKRTRFRRAPAGSAGRSEPKECEILAMAAGAIRPELQPRSRRQPQPGSVQDRHATALNSAYDENAEERSPGIVVYGRAETFMYGRGQTYA